MDTTPSQNEYNARMDTIWYPKVEKPSNFREFLFNKDRPMPEAMLIRCGMMMEEFQCKQGSEIHKVTFSTQGDKRF